MLRFFFRHFWHIYGMDKKELQIIGCIFTFHQLFFRGLQTPGHKGRVVKRVLNKLKINLFKLRGLIWMQSTDTTQSIFLFFQTEFWLKWTTFDLQRLANWSFLETDSAQPEAEPYLWRKPSQNYSDPSNQRETETEKERERERERERESGIIFRKRECAGENGGAKKQKMKAVDIKKQGGR